MLIRYLTLISLIVLLFSTLQAAENGDKVTLVIDAPQTAGISGFRKWWDTPQPDALVFDAVHRGLLVRFPGAAEQIAGQIAKGYAIDKVELVLPFKNTDTRTYNGQPDSYADRLSFGGEENYTKNKPRWHAVAWPLRKPWIADKTLGPTFNAYINGTGYWGKYGAQDEKKDRFPRRLGPAEVSTVAATGRMDLTALLADKAFGKSLAARLRAFTDCGLLLKKWELYDFRFRKPGDGAYEWQVATGGFGLYINAPRLEVTFVPAANAEGIGKLPPAVDIRILVEKMKSDGYPTAVMPGKDELAKILERFAMKQPAWMPDWQWQRVKELDALGGGYRIPNTPEAYEKWVDGMLAVPPRYWNGFDAPDMLQVYYLYKDALPAYVQEHYFRDYWTAWLMPDRPTSTFEHPQAIELWYGGNNKYYNETGDWRGNASPYRDGYCNVISTMNFNHWSALGALLGGKVIDSKYAMEDGRHGLEYQPLRLWAWYDGSAQESIDHYYYALTVGCQKMFADFGPTALDRLMGQSCLAKSLEELTTGYHPGLRHFIACSSRTGVPEFLLTTQDGLQHVIHTLSPSGALHDIGNTDLPEKFPVLNPNVSPGRVAQDAVTGLWAPEWVSHIVDDKPLPFEITATDKQYGRFVEQPRWKKTFLGHHYGLASGDVRFGCVPAMAQWRREDRQVSRVQELGTMLLRVGFNDPPIVNAAPGWVDPQGSQAILQHRNKMVVVTSPYDLSKREGVKSVQSTAAFYNYQQPQPTWEIYVDGQRVTALPFKAKQGQRITIKDGVTFIGLIPLPSSNLVRTDEVVLEVGKPQTQYPDYKVMAALNINSYVLQRDAPLDKGADWKAIDLAYGGYAMEMGDVTEYKDFAAFQQHMRDVKLETRWEPAQVTLHVKYTSGTDTLEMGCRTDYPFDEQSDRCFAYRRVNGAWPYLPAGIDRDTTLTQLGTAGRLEKNGAGITCEPGVMAYLQTEPVSGTYAGFNPLPDPSCWAFSVPGGITVKADGRLGLARVIVRPKEQKIWVDYGVKDDQHTGDMASTLLVFGMPGEPSVELNGKPLAKVATAVIDGKSAYVIPLFEGAVVPKDLAARCQRAEKLFDLLCNRKDAGMFVQDWYIAGPFYNDFLGKGFLTAYPPEKGIDLAATYTGVGLKDDKVVDAPVGWKHILAAGQPALAATPVNLLNLLTPNKAVCAYAYTEITSDRERDVTLFTGSDEHIAVWVNGQQVLSTKAYRAALKDQDKAPIHLKKGRNTVLVKLAHGYEAWHFYFRLADAYGFPVTEGISYGVVR